MRYIVGSFLCALIGLFFIDTYDVPAQAIEWVNSNVEDSVRLQDATPMLVGGITVSIPFVLFMLLSKLFRWIERNDLKSQIEAAEDSVNTEKAKAQTQQAQNNKVLQKCKNQRELLNTYPGSLVTVDTNGEVNRILIKQEDEIVSNFTLGRHLADQLGVPEQQRFLSNKIDRALQTNERVQVEVYTHADQPFQLMIERHSLQTDTAFVSIINLQDAQRVIRLQCERAERRFEQACSVQGIGGFVFRKTDLRIKQAYGLFRKAVEATNNPKCALEDVILANDLIVEIDNGLRMLRPAKIHNVSFRPELNLSIWSMRMYVWSDFRSPNDVCGLIVDETRLAGLMLENQKMHKKLSRETQIWYEARLNERKDLRSIIHELKNQVASIQRFAQSNQTKSDAYARKITQQIEKPLDELKLLSSVLQKPDIQALQAHGSLARNLVAATASAVTNRVQLSMPSPREMEKLPHMPSDPRLGIIKRTIIELICNADKHADCGSSEQVLVSMKIEQKKEILLIIIEDNGTRFKPESIEDGTGLSSLRSRLHTQGMDLRIERKTSGGFRGIVMIPTESSIAKV